MDQLTEVGPDTPLIRGEEDFDLQTAEPGEIMQDGKQWHPVQLPSHGFYYDDKLPGGDVWITPWTTLQEELMVRYGGVSASELTRDLIASNIRFKGKFRYNDLLLNDEFFLLVQLRMLSLTPLYTFEIQCPQCKKTKNKVSVDLSKLSYRAPDPDWPGEPIEVSLPVSGVTVGLKYLRTGDKKRIEAYSKKKEDAGASLNFRRALRIDTIDGEKAPLQDRQEFIRNLILKDMRIIDITYEKYEPGYLLDISVPCSDRGCGYITDTAIEQSDSFFRPDESDLAGAPGLDDSDQE